MFIRVRDPQTRHEFDVPEDSSLLAAELVEPVKQDRYPPSQYPRPPKHHLTLSSAPTGATEANPEEEPSG